MFRFFFKRRSIRKQRQKLVKVYPKLIFVNSNSSVSTISYYNTNFTITLPKRQQIFTFYDLKKLKLFGFTSGVFLKKMGRQSKCFKRDAKNILSMMLHFKKLYNFFLKYIYLFVLNNYNYRQYLFFKKFCEMFLPEINYFVHRQSFMPKFLNKRRIKRRVLRRLKSSL